MNIRKKSIMREEKRRFEKRREVNRRLGNYTVEQGRIGKRAKKKTKARNSGEDPRGVKCSRKDKMEEEIKKEERQLQVLQKRNLELKR